MPLSRPPVCCSAGDAEALARLRDSPHGLHSLLQILEQDSKADLKTLRLLEVDPEEAIRYKEETPYRR